MTIVLVWKEFRERLLTLTFLSLVPLAAAAWGWRLGLELEAGLYAALGCALLTGASLTMGTGAGGFLPFERQLPARPLALWFYKHLFGLVALAMVVGPVGIAMCMLEGKIQSSCPPGLYLAVAALLYAAGAYSSCCAHTNLGALLLAAVIAATFYGIAHEGFQAIMQGWIQGWYRIFGRAVFPILFGRILGGKHAAQMQQALCSSTLLIAASAFAFRHSVRCGETGFGSRLALAAAGMFAAVLGTSAPGLAGWIEWRHSDSSDVVMFNIRSAPAGQRALLTSLRLGVPRRRPGLPRRQTELVYDGESDTLTGIDCKLYGYTARWSPSGVGVTANGPRGMRLITFPNGKPVVEVPRGWSQAEWVTDREIAFVATIHSQRVAGLFDTTRGERITTYELDLLSGHETLLGTHNRRPICVQWPSRLGRGAPEDVSARVIDLRDGSVVTWSVVPDARPLRMSPDGQYILLRRPAKAALDSELWLYEVATQKARRLQSVVTDGLSDTRSLGSVFSPDGQWLVVPWQDARTQERRHVIEAIRLASGNRVVIRERVPTSAAPRISPNSRFVTGGRFQTSIQVFPLPPSPDGPKWVIDDHVRALFWSHDWLGNDKLIFQARLAPVSSLAKRVPEPIRKRGKAGLQTLWIADLQTKEIRMIWPERWVHPTWRVLSGKEWKEKRK